MSIIVYVHVNSSSTTGTLLHMEIQHNTGTRYRRLPGTVISQVPPVPGTERYVRYLVTIVPTWKVKWRTKQQDKKTTTSKTTKRLYRYYFSNFDAEAAGDGRLTDETALLPPALIAL